MYYKTIDIALNECPEKLYKKVSIILIKDKKTKIARIIKMDEFDDNYQFLNSVYKAYLYSDDGTYSIIKHSEEDLDTSFILKRDLKIIIDLEMNKQKELTYIKEYYMSIEYFVDTILPIISASLFICASLAGVYKYIRSKNTQYYEKMLSELYAPLYQFLVRQKTIVTLAPSLYNEHFAILCDLYVKTEIDGEISKLDIANLSHDEFINVRKNTNIAIAPSRLLILMNEYEAILALRNIKDRYKSFRVDAEIYKPRRRDIEEKLLTEIIVGYLKYIMLYKYSFITRRFHKKRECESIENTAY